MCTLLSYKRFIIMFANSTLIGISILPTNHLSVKTYCHQYNRLWCTSVMKLLLPGDGLGREHCKRCNTIHCHKHCNMIHCHTKTAAQVIKSSLVPRPCPAFCCSTEKRGERGIISHVWHNRKMAKICTPITAAFYILFYWLHSTLGVYNSHLPLDRYTW